MKALFLNPPSFPRRRSAAGCSDKTGGESRSIWYPTWLAQAAALVDGSRVIDAAADGLTVGEVIEKAGSFDLFFIYTTTPTFDNDAGAAALIRKRRPDALIGLVGPHVSTLAEESLGAAPAVNFVIRGEFEIPAAEIASGIPPSRVAGISWRDSAGIWHNPDAQPATDLEHMPRVLEVYRRDLTIHNYRASYLRHPFLAIQTGRTCPGSCPFCLWPDTPSGRYCRVRTPESIYREVAEARELFCQVKEFFIEDDSLALKPERAVSVARALGRTGVVWSALGRVSMSYDTLRILRENGLRLLKVNFQSGSDEILQNIGAGTTENMARCFVRNCRQLGIAVYGSFTLGLPGETRESVEQTIRLASSLGPYVPEVSVVSFCPGTEQYLQAVGQGRLPECSQKHTHAADREQPAGRHLSEQELRSLAEDVGRRCCFRRGRMFASAARAAASSDRLTKRKVAAESGTGLQIGLCQFQITTACNAACAACACGAGGLRGGASVCADADDCRVALNILAENGVGWLVVTGGEPVMHPQITGILSHARSVGMATLMRSNGWALDEGVVSELADAGLGAVLISMDSPSASSHDSQRGLPGLTKRIEEANCALARRGISSVASVSITRLLGDLTRLSDFLRSLGFSRVHFSYNPREQDCGCLRYAGDELVNFSDTELVRVYQEITELRHTIQVINPLASLREAQRFLMAKPRMYDCLAGRTIFHLDTEFNLFRCQDWHKPICRLWEMDISKLPDERCRRCSRDFYRDVTVMQHLGVALEDAGSSKAAHAAKQILTRKGRGSLQARIDSSNWLRMLRR